jgi:glycosyltransferase involved in cell wall biosynthesis
MVTTSYPPAPGVASGPFVHHLAARLVGRGYQVTVLAPHTANAVSRVQDGVQSVFFRYAPTRWETLAHGDGIAFNLAADHRRGLLVAPLLGACALAAARYAAGADVVHAHWLAAGVATRVVRGPRVVTVHGSDLAVAARAPLVVRAALGSAEAIVVNEEMAMLVRRVAPGVAVRVAAPQGVEMTPAPYQQAVAGRVVFVGRLVDIKGVDTLLAAWPSVREALPHATLEVVGDGPLRGIVRGDGVTRRGALLQHELAAVYRDAAVVCVPSRRDSFALACVEAMAAGRPVVCTPVGDMADRVRDGVDGLLVAPDDPAGLADALIRILRDPGRGAAMGRHARERASSRHAWPAVLDAVESAYADAVSASARRPASRRR